MVSLGVGLERLKTFRTLKAPLRDALAEDRGVARGRQRARGRAASDDSHALEGSEGVALALPPYPGQRFQAPLALRLARCIACPLK
jgi:hypothetical protein